MPEGRQGHPRLTQTHEEAAEHPLGGHFVSGHVDCVGTIAERMPSGEWETVWLTFPREHGAARSPLGKPADDEIEQS